MNTHTYDTKHIANEPPPRARLLLIRYFRKTITMAEHEELDQWIAASESNMIIFENWLEMESNDPSLSFLKPQFVKSFLHEKKPKLFWPVAASVFGLILTLGFTIYTFNLKDELLQRFAGQPKKPDLSNQRFSVTTTPDSIKYFRLPDSTGITLMGSSRLEYPAVFSGSIHSVTLTGAARFKFSGSGENYLFIYTKEFSVTSQNGDFLVNANAPADSITIQVFSGYARLNKGTDAWNINQGELANYGNKSFWRIKF